MILNPCKLRQIYTILTCMIIDISKDSFLMPGSHQAWNFVVRCFTFLNNKMKTRVTNMSVLAHFQSSSSKVLFPSHSHLIFLANNLPILTTYLPRLMAPLHRCSYPFSEVLFVPKVATPYPFLIFCLPHHLLGFFASRYISLALLVFTCNHFLYVIFFLKSASTSLFHHPVLFVWSVKQQVVLGLGN